MKFKIGNKNINLNLKILIIAAVAAFCIILIVSKFYAAKYYRVVDISDYIKVTYTGVEGGGKAKFSLESDKLYRQLAGSEKSAIVLTEIKDIIASVNIETDEKKLSNGDHIKVKVSYNSELAKKIDCRFKKLKYSAKVGGLSEGKKIDIFKNVEVVIAGVSPEAFATVSNKWEEDDLKNIAFTIIDPTNISKGDTVKVRCEATDDEIMAKGYLPESLSKEYKVDKVNCYISDVNQLDAGVLASINSEAIETIRKETENLRFRMFYKATGDSAYLFQFNNEWVNKTELVKTVFLTKKENAEVDTRNYIYYIYKSNISNDSVTADIYFAFEYFDGIITTDDKCVISHENQSVRYICGLDYDNIYGRTVNSKAGSYEIIEVSGIQ